MKHGLVFMKNPKIGPICGLPQKTSSFFNAEFVCCQNDEKMWWLVIDNILKNNYKIFFHKKAIKFEVKKNGDFLISLLIIKEKLYVHIV